MSHHPLKEVANNGTIRLPQGRSWQAYAKAHSKGRNVMILIAPFRVLVIVSHLLQGVVLNHFNSRSIQYRACAIPVSGCMLSESRMAPFFTITRAEA